MKNRPRTASNNTKGRLVIWAVLVVLILAFIWGNSILSVAQSTQESRWMLKLVTPFLERFAGAGNVTDHLVRKIAHFVEFSALGFGLYWLFRLIGRRFAGIGNRFGGHSSGGFGSSGSGVSTRSGGGLRALVRAAFCGFFAGFFDETIQLFTGRGAQISDVWLDFAGVCAGALLAALIGLFARPRD